MRFHLLAYPAAAASNVSVRVTDVQRRTAGEGAALFMSVHLKRDGGEGKLHVPLQFEVEGARSELMVEMDGRELELKNHRIPLAKEHVQGWGRVSIPADENPADNEFYFVFDAPPPRVTSWLPKIRSRSRPLELAAGSAPDPAVKSEVKVLAPDKLTDIPWEESPSCFGRRHCRQVKRRTRFASL